MTKTAFYAIVLLLLSSLIPLQADESLGRILQQDLGRSYGLVVGDLIEHHYIIEIDKSYSLTQSSLPATGDINYWLTLRNIQIHTTERNEHILYRLDLTYQTFYAPLDVRELTIPSIQLDFSNVDNKTFSLDIANWSFTMSPIKEITPRGVGTESKINRFMKASIPPSPISLSPLKNALWLYTGLLFCSILLFLIISGWISGLSRSPFIKARKTIRKLAKTSDPSQQLNQHCLQALHKAINQRAGHTVFSHQLAQFLHDNPQFAALHESLKQFYQHSQDCFFLGKATEPKLIEKCAKLCQQLADADKVSTSS